MQVISITSGQKFRQILNALAVVSCLAMTTFNPVQAEGQQVEERFQDLFVTAGYATAFGAAIGTAFLAFHEDPSQHLRYVAIGASLGFLGGSILGSYVIFSPMIGDTSDVTANSLIASSSIPAYGIAVRPTWNQTEHQFAGVEAGMSLLNF